MLLEGIQKQFAILASASPMFLSKTELHCTARRYRCQVGILVIVGGCFGDMAVHNTH